MFSADLGVTPSSANYIEDVFSTYLYTGNSGTQTITNGIDLSTKGGMVWIKSRQQTDGSTSPIGEHGLWDTSRGAGTSGTTNKAISSNATSAEGLGWTDADYISSFGTNGFTVQNSGGTTTHRIANHAFQNYASWTFRKQAKFFDVVTYTGNGTASRAISHNLGSAPGMMIVKQLNGVRNWPVYHRSVPTGTGYLNRTEGFFTGSGNGVWGDASYNNIAPTSTVFYVGSDSEVNGNGLTYVAYLFAHDAGGFGATGADNVISCGSFTTDGSGNATVNLGYEPQWVLIKAATGASEDWVIDDVMRGAAWERGAAYALYPNLANAETFTGLGATPTNTGFSGFGSASRTYIYIAIRRGPMRTPTSGTSVFGLNARTGTGANATVTGGQTDDAVLIKNRGSAVASLFSSRLTGTGYLVTSSTAAEVAAGTTILQANPWDVMDGVKVGTTSTITNASANTFINYLFRRAPGFFDVVCYTGTASSTTRNHNLASVPELIISKPRGGTGDWTVYTAATGINQKMFLNDTAGATTTTAIWGASLPTSTTWTQLDTSIVSSGQTAISYLFGSIAGVSKVGSYTGTGTTKQINCGFTGGARFVLIKRTDSTGDWYVWDTARGIVAGNDPYLLLNSTAAEVTSTDYVDTYSAGFEISSTAPAAINANGGSFIFWAVA
jgi:hypothetical protein